MTSFDDRLTIRSSVSVFVVVVAVVALNKRSPAIKIMGGPLRHGCWGVGVEYGLTNGNNSSTRRLSTREPERVWPTIDGGFFFEWHSSSGDNVYRVLDLDAWLNRCLNYSQLEEGKENKR